MAATILKRELFDVDSEGEDITSLVGFTIFPRNFLLNSNSVRASALKRTLL